MAPTAKVRVPPRSVTALATDIPLGIQRAAGVPQWAVREEAAL